MSSGHTLMLWLLQDLPAAAPSAQPQGEEGCWTRWLVTEGEQTSSASAWLCPAPEDKKETPTRPGTLESSCCTGEGTEAAAMQGPATCSAEQRAGAAYPELPSHVSNTRHSCHTAARTTTGSERGINRTEQERNTTLCPVSARWPHPIGPAPPSAPGLYRRDRTTQPENTEQKGTGWGIARSRGSSPDAGAVGGVLTFPRGCGHRLSCSSVPPVAHFPPRSHSVLSQEVSKLLVSPLLWTRPWAASEVGRLMCWEERPPSTTRGDQELQACGPEPPGQWACAPSHRGSLRTHLAPGTIGGEWYSLILQGRISFVFYKPPGGGQQLYLQHYSLPKPSQITRRLLPQHLNLQSHHKYPHGLDSHSSTEPRPRLTRHPAKGRPVSAGSQAPRCAALSARGVCVHVACASVCAVGACTLV